MCVRVFLLSRGEGTVREGGGGSGDRRAGGGRRGGGGEGEGRGG